MAPPVIDVRHASKVYRIYAHPRHRLFEALSGGRRVYHREFRALHDVTFQVEAGTTLGVVGMNGSGKSTLLQMIAGIVQPSAGEVVTRGRIASLLELGAGFSPEFTGRENVMMNGAIAGLRREESLARLPEVEAFAEIGDFMDRPVKTYSSGMFVRLAFAAAIHVDPDILLVDEALAVGDASFQHRCVRRIQELQRRGKTILFVSHDTRMVTGICTRALFLHAGEVQALGDPDTVVNRYHGHLATVVGRAREVPAAAAPLTAAPAAPGFRPDPGFEQRASLFRHGTGAARVRNVELLDTEHRPLAAAEFNQEIVLRVHLEFFGDAEEYILGYYFRDKAGIEVIGTNTFEENATVPPRAAGQTLVVDYRHRLPLMPGSYSVTVGLAYHRHAPVYYDWVDNALVLEVLPPPGGKVIYAKVWLPVQIDIHA
jgi:ABC-type polysaccharide/polyol phosphate transport system ATPase subunit